MASDIIVRVRAEGVDDFTKKLKESGAVVEDVGDKTEKTEKRMSSSFKKIGAYLGAAFATEKIIQFGAAMVKLAVQLDSVEAKFKKVFGTSARIVEDFAKKNAVSLGLTISEYKRAAAAAGDLLIPLGFQRDEAAKLSSGLVNLSGALAAWSGGQFDAAQTSEILTKALLGEREQLKTLGINIQEADVSARLLEKGQSKLTGTMLQQAKATATLELIMEKSRDAQDAFADSTKTLTETSQVLSATMRQLTEDFAKGLTEGIRPLAEELQKISDNKEATESIMALGQAFGFLLSAVAKLLIAEGKVISFFDKIPKPLKAIIEILPGVGVLAQGIDWFTGSVKSSTEAVDEYAIAIEDLAKQYQVLADGFDVSTESSRDWLDELERIKKAEETAEETAKRLKKQKEDEAKALELARKAWKDYWDAVKDEETFFNQPGVLSAKDITEREAKIYEDGFAELESLLDDEVEKDLAAWNERTKNAKAAQDDQVKIAKEAEEKKRAFQLETVSQIAQIQSVASQIATVAIQRELAALEERHDKGLVSETEYQKQRAQLQEKGAKAAKADALFRAIIGVANGVIQGLASPFPLNIVLPAIAAALGAAQIGIIAAQPIPKFAKGTKGAKTAPAGFAWVGEQGPELIRTKGNEKIITADDSEQLVKLLGGYGIPVQFKRTEDDLYKPMKSLADIRKTKNGIDWNPLLDSNHRGARYTGKKLDRIYEAIMLQGQGRKMTAN